MMVRVLVVEDDAELAETVAVGLRRRQLAVDVALDGRSGLDRALFTNYDVIVLDRDLPCAALSPRCRRSPGAAASARPSPSAPSPACFPRCAQRGCRPLRRCEPPDATTR